MRSVEFLLFVVLRFVLVFASGGLVTLSQLFKLLLVVVLFCLPIVVLFNAVTVDVLFKLVPLFAPKSNMQNISFCGIQDGVKSPFFRLRCELKKIDFYFNVLVKFFFQNSVWQIEDGVTILNFLVFLVLLSLYILSKIFY